MMKKACFLMQLFLFFFLVHSNCQTRPEVDTNFTVCQSALKEYKIDSCLLDLLIDIEESDSMNLTYPPSAFFYELTFTTNEVDKELKISLSRWQKVRTFDYTGIIIINRMSFLCRGIAIKYDKLFTKTKNTVEVTLKKPKVYQNDDIDVVIENSIKSPVLAGRYRQCDGYPVNVFVYTGKKMERYGTSSP